MVTDSRARILEFLKRNGSGSVAELSRGLGLTPVTIRHHLEALLGDDLVEEPVARRRPGPGRPEMAYRLTPAADPFLPRNYGELCACVVRTLQSEPESMVGSALAAAGAALGRSQLGRPGLGRMTRPDVLLNILESRGYLPSWQTDNGSTRLVLSNCPYLEVAREAPGICQFDLALVQTVLGADVTLEASIAAHDPACRVRLPQVAV
jgi:predicted ArsR family transcriptional regulator